MDREILRNLLSRLNRYAFESFIYEMFKTGYGADHFRPLEGLGEGIYSRDLEDYVLPPEEGEESHYGLFDAVYLIHFLPLEVFRRPNETDVNDPELKRRLESVRRFYAGKAGYPSLRGFMEPRLQAIFFLNNFAGFSIEEYVKYLIPKYIDLAKDSGLHVRKVDLGNFDSFLENKPLETEQAFRQFLATDREGICISLSQTDASVARFRSEKQLFAGVATQSKHPYEPVFVYDLSKKEKLLSEFESLIRKETKESQLEEFLVAHYRDIFGPKYDRIETQLWLRFPDLDIAGKERRLDLFLRNSVANDWELFEIKRVINLTRTYRDVPVIAREVVYAIQQVKNYARILSQDAVKRHFAREGIVYYEPALHLIVGRRPQISQSQWRWLVTSNTDVKLITFDELIEEMRLRLRDHLSVSQTLSLNDLRG